MVIGGTDEGVGAAGGWGQVSFYGLLGFQWLMNLVPGWRTLFYVALFRNGS